MMVYFVSRVKATNDKKKLKTKKNLATATVRFYFQ